MRSIFDIAFLQQSRNTSRMLEKNPEGVGLEEMRRRIRANFERVLREFYLDARGLSQLCRGKPSSNYICRYQLGQQRLGPEALKRISTGLGLPVSFFFIDDSTEIGRHKRAGFAKVIRQQLQQSLRVAAE